mgnify:CR=1 FL=1
MRTVDVGSQAGAGRRRVLRIPVIALLVLGCSVRGGPAADPTEDPRLADLLAHMSRVASLYRALALRFECTETLEYTAREDWPSRSGFARFSYLYQRDEEGRFEDCRLYRTTLTTAERSRCVLPDEPGMPLYLRNAYLWILAFSDTRRPWHEYRIAGEQAVLGRPAILVEFGPRGAVRPGVNDWYGRAWIDRDTYQLLRVHALRPQYQHAKEALERARMTNVNGGTRAAEYEVESVETEFGEEKNGMRFVSEIRLHVARYRWVKDYREEALLDVRQTYRDYRFFRIASREEIGAIVRGEDPTAAPR